MLKKTIRLAVCAALITGSAIAYQASPASAATTAGVAVFLGDAKVGPGTAAGGNGLCFPGLNPAASCAPAPGVIPPPNGFTFNVPGGGVTPPAGPAIPGQCIAAGVINGVGPDIDLSCNFTSAGTVSGPLGPTCGNSIGAGASTFNITDPLINPANDATVNVNFGWVSAGGTLIVTGTGNPLAVGLVQARPIGLGVGTVPCLNVPATTFTVLGVLAVAGV